jgi:hypothetical protein
MSLNLFDQERSALVRFTGAIHARAAAEAEIGSTFQTAGDKAEREVVRARRANAAARERELTEIEAEHQRRAKEITDRFEADKYTLIRGRDEKQAVMLDRYRMAEQRARTEYQDRLWTIDSVLEGGQKKAKDQLDSLQRHADSGRQQVKELWKPAERLLTRVRVNRDDVDYFGALELKPDDDPATGMQRSIEVSSDALASLKSLLLPRLHGIVGFIICILLASAVGAVSFVFAEVQTAAVITAAVGVILGVGLWLLLRSAARRQVRRVGSAFAEKQAIAEAACRNLHDFAAAQYQAESERVTEKHARKRKETQEYYEPLLEQRKQQLDTEIERLVADHETAMAALVECCGRDTQAADESHDSRRAEMESRLNEELAGFEKRYTDKLAAATAGRDAAWERMASEWRTATSEVSSAIANLRAEGERVFPAWAEIDRDDRPLPERIIRGIRYGSLEIDPPSIPDAISADARLAPPDDLAGPLPAFLPFPDRCSLLLKARDDGRATAVSALQAIMLRFLTGLPPGKVRFTIIDPVGLGENFAAFMHLADHDEKLVTGQIWTEPRAVEQRLVDLTDHIASVHQKYLRSQYSSIEEYNQAAGEVAEAYRVLVVANFPENFTPEAAKRLLSIASSGPSCGVCALVSVDTRAAMPRDFTLADLEAVSLVLGRRDGRFTPRDEAFSPFPLELDAPPDPAAIARIVQRVGKASVEAVRVEVPFEYIAPKPGEIWQASAAKGFDVPVGRAGATRRQVFSLGRGTAQHALIAGKTGSGKSTLLHALITNLALTYSPDEAELYLIDFKEGVEFQWYATYRLPHARVVAIQSEREFGLSVLQRLDGILRERGERFRDAGVNDLASYRAERPNDKTPRILLVVDEFQQFFVEDDKLAQEAALLLDRLVRQGRAFGLHVLLGSQTLGGAYSLARSTIDQMAVRVALQCSDADAQLILSKDNTAARLLSRPGEAIYNDQNGLVEGNDPFQVVWLSDEKREDLLRMLGDRAAGQFPPPLVFEGNTAADIAKNPALARVLEVPAWPAETKAPSIWLGDPVAIKEPTAAIFRAQGAANLLQIGQNEEAARGLFAAGLIALAAQLQPDEAATFTLLDGTPDDVDDAEYLRRLAQRLPQRTALPDRAQLPAALAELAAEIERRQKGETYDRSARFLFVFGVQRFRELRKSEDDFGFGRRGGDREPPPAERFATILREGPALGVHVTVWCDSLTNLNRTFDRVLLREFGLRVLFQMSPTDSSTLMDSPAASRLGRTRALFLREEQERPEKFRPYGLPPAEWLDGVMDRLRQRIGLKEPAAGV